MVEVEATEDETFVLVLERGHASGGVEDERVALEEPGHLLVAHIAGAVGAAARHAVHGHEIGALPGLGELGVDTVQMLLLDGDLGSDGVDVGVGHRASCSPSGGRKD